MTERIVDALEIIEVQRQQAKLLAVAPGLGNGLHKPVFEQPPVGKSRQRVNESHLAHDLLVSGPLADIADNLDGPGDGTS